MLLLFNKSRVFLLLLLFKNWLLRWVSLFRNKMPRSWNNWSELCSWRIRSWSPRRKKSRSCDASWTCCEIQDVFGCSNGDVVSELGRKWWECLQNVFLLKEHVLDMILFKSKLLDVHRCGVLSLQWPRRGAVNEMLYAGHSKVSLAIDNTFEELWAEHRV